MNIGDRLLSILNGAQESIRIAAPFIKAQALTRVLKCVSDNVQVTCIARWRPEDIASGVCDLEIFDIIKERKRSALLIHPHLHAKFYSADAFCLVGSANLSDTALGWRRPSNFELLVEINASDHELDGWWDSLFHEAIEATEEIRSALAKKAVELRDSAIQIAQLDVSQDSAEDNMVWVPECPRWDGLWEVYSGDEEQLTNSAIGSAKSDLEALGLPPGMDKYSFESALKTALRIPKFSKKLIIFHERALQMIRLMICSKINMVYRQLT